MMTLAIIVGISEYKESTFFKNLPAAKSDAAWMKRTLISLGIPKENIKSLIDSDATKMSIKSSIRKWAFERAINQEEVRLFIFFSCHGVLVSENNLPVESSLIAYDTEFQDKLGTGLPLYELVRDIRRIEIQELYIFLDACFMSLNSVARSIGELPGLSLFKRISSTNCFLCMVANNEDKAIERKTGGLGFFTNSVINGFTEINKNPKPKISSFIDSVQSYHRAHNIGIPSMIMAGTLNSWFFNKLKESSTIPKLGY